MFDFFSGLFSFVVKAAEAVVSIAAKAIAGEMFSSAPSRSEASAKCVIDNLKDIDREISDRERSIAKSKSRLDAESLAELLDLRSAEYDKYEKIKAADAVDDLEKNADKYSESKLILGTEHKLQYHLGVAVINRKCQQCYRPMKLQHRTVDDPKFDDFFWQCTGFYDSNAQCKNTLPFRARDLSLLHNNDAIELEISKDDLITIASQKTTQAQTIKRLTGHLGEEDQDVPCPIHFVPMYLREKRGGESLPMLDRYHLACTHKGCGQIAKLKSYPQLAAFLRRKEGQGIIH
ncbi:hypothetical protein ACUNV4_28945 [Granulosicoccus sp. 3-233]|uniref:hypothetical protein n=1 Tax=Granulosicoccus sp. 3-233 TaxID=3417969 RepID=UPI003D329468